MPVTFTTTERVKRRLRIPAAVTCHDTLLGELADEANDELLHLLREAGAAGITDTTYSEVHDVERSGVSELRLMRWPVVSVAALTDNDTAVAAADFYTDTAVGYVRLVDRYFTPGRQQVEVTYTAGWGSTAPDDLVRAATILACEAWNTDAHAGMRSEGREGYRYTRSDQVLPPAVARILGRYRDLFARDGGARDA